MMCAFTIKADCAAAVIHCLITSRLRRPSSLMFATRRKLANPSKAYWLVLPLRRPSVSLYWRIPWTSPTASNYEEAKRNPATSTWLMFLCVCVFISQTWPSSKMVSRSLWRRWRTTCSPVCPQLQESSWVTQRWWKIWRRPNALQLKSKRRSYSFFYSHIPRFKRKAPIHEQIYIRTWAGRSTGIILCLGGI